jgi:hypothetical protein
VQMVVANMAHQMAVANMAPKPCPLWSGDWITI